MFRPLSSLLLLGVAFAVPAHAACTAANSNGNVAESTPTSAFTVNAAAGTVTHALTGLTWKQCSQGQSGATCATGSATTMTWSDALASAAADTTDGGGWRLPNKKELESIVERCGYNPVINQTVFPATAVLGYWSASSYVPNAAKAWSVFFNVGSSNANPKLNLYNVRLVRGGQSLDTFDALAPDTTPSTFTFTPQSGVALSAVATSNTITVSGINTASAISITGGTYAVNGGGYTSSSGTVNNGDTVSVQQSASASYGVLTQATLSIGGVSAAFDVTTPGRLPDTGQTLCYNASAADGVVAASDPASIARDAGTHPRQDCRYGRDQAGASKTGAGEKGLDYSKIANNGTKVAAGTALGTGATDWACTQDNITGLMWEVKTTSGLRNKDHTYRWYSSNASTNGGNAGTANGGSCSGGSGCDTEKFVADVNAANLCGHADWRLPTHRELRTLVLYDRSGPSIDPVYFSNTQSTYYWSASSYVPGPASAWGVSFNVGLSGANGKSNGYYVRLVRGGQF